MHQHKGSFQGTIHIEILIYIACRGELTWVAHMTGKSPRGPETRVEGFLPRE